MADDPYDQGNPGREDSNGRTALWGLAQSLLPLDPAANAPSPAEPDAGAGDGRPAADPAVVVFVDPAFADAATLSDATDTGITTIVLDPNQDGLQQIADYLAGQSYLNLAAIGIVAPGEDGNIVIGDSVLSLDTIGQFTKPLAEIGAAVQPGGQLIFQGSDVASDPGGRDLLTQIAAATGIRVGVPLAGAVSGGEAAAPSGDTAATGGASPVDPEVWAAIFPNLVVHADNLGSNVATNTATLYSGNASFTSFFGSLRDVQLDTAHGQYFLLDDGGGHDEIWHGNLTQALNSTGPTFTGIYTDPAAGDRISNIEVDPVDQLIYFTDNNSNTGLGSSFERMDYSGGNRTTLYTFTGIIPDGGLALDLPHSRAYVTFGKSNSITSSGLALATGVNRIYVASNVTAGATSLAFTSMPLTFPTATDIEGLTIDTANQILYFTADTISAGGIFAYTLAANPTLSSGALRSVYSDAVVTKSATSAFGTLDYITYDPATGKYYLPVDQSAGSTNDSGIFIGGTAGGAPTRFLAVTAGSNGPEGLFIDDEPTLTPSHGGTWTEGGAAIAVDSSIAVSKPDTTLLASATVAITGNFASGDTLAATTAGTSITATYTSATGVLTLSGADTLAHYQNVLDSVSFNTSADTAVTSRTITFTASDGLMTGSATDTVTLVQAAEAPTFTGSTSFSGSEEGTIALSGIGVGTKDSDDTLGATATISGISSGWTVIDPGKTTIVGSGIVSSGSFAQSDIGALVVTAPDAGTNATDNLTLTVTASEGASAATGTRVLAVTATAGPAEAPTFTGSTSFSGSEEGTITLSGIGVGTKDSDDTLGATATISGISSGWTVIDPGKTTIVGSGIVSSGSFAQSDIGALVVTSPDAGANATDSLTLTVSSSEGGSTNASAVVVVTATAGPAEAPTLTTQNTTATVGVTTISLTIGDTADGDDTLSLVTIAGVPPGFSLNEGSDGGGGTWTENPASLGSLALIAPANDTATVLTLSVTAMSSEAGQSATSTAVLQVDIVPCFCAGTRILSVAGEIAVEDLAIGDRVMTHAGVLRPIRWIGQRAYEPRFVAGNRKILPIRIEAGALAEGVPARDLLVSPEHALYLDGALVPAGLLVNSATIRQVGDIDRLEYFHIELDTHDVILAEGAAAETFVDCNNRGMFQNSDDFARRYPDATPARWEFCAPRAEEGAAELPGIRALILARAEALGRVTSDPGLHLVCDGRLVAPRLVGSNRAYPAGAAGLAGGQGSAVAPSRVYYFAVPGGARAVSLASRSAVPAEAEAASRDRRSLGVAVERVTLRDAGSRIEIGPDSPLLSDGFHMPEGTHRWSNGEGWLHEGLLAAIAGDVFIEVHVAETALHYPADMAVSSAEAGPGTSRDPGRAPIIRRGRR